MIKVAPRERPGTPSTPAPAIKRYLRRIETLGKPVVAAINGAALGGGYEIALACHHRVALDAPGSKIGLPEVTLGLLPGGGGVTRTVRLLGIADALLKVLLQGTQYTPQRALENGLVHEVAATREEMLAKARAFIDANPESQQPWDVKGYRIPGGTPSNPKFAANLPAFPANLSKQLERRALPGAAQHPRRRRRGLPGRLRDRPDHRGPLLHRAGHRPDLQEHDPGVLLRPPGRQLRRQPPQGHRAAPGPQGRRARRRDDGRGHRLLLRPARASRSSSRTSPPRRPPRARRTREKLLAKAVSRGRTTRGEGATRCWPASRPTADPADLAGCDAVIEAVFEDTALKHKVFQEIQDVVAPDALLCSNTSTLPITVLAEGVDAPGRLHRPALLLARRQDAAGRDHQGRADRRRGAGPRLRPGPPDQARRRSSSTTRAASSPRGSSATSSTRASRWSARASSPRPIEQAAAQAGYPAKVLSLMDELTLTLPRKIRDETQARGRGGRRHLDRRTPPTRSSTAWSTSSAARAAAAARASTTTARTAGAPGSGPACASTSPSPGHRDPLRGHAGADALLRGAGHRPLPGGGRPHLGRRRQHRLHPRHRLPARWTGGVLQYINGYEGGLPGFVARARELADRYGDRFTPPALLVEKAEKGETFTTDPASSLLAAGPAFTRPWLTSAA